MEEGPELRILGDGPLHDTTVRMLQSRPNSRIRLLGQVTPSEAQREIAKAKLLVVPSEWFEGFPMVIGEAFAFGTPVAVSNIGALPSLVQRGVTGIVFEPGDADSLRREIQKAWNAAGLLERLSLSSRQAFEQSYTEGSNYRLLMEVYARAIANQRGRA
jgi:glycosyltransferase involved in cell wall biosynthesis